MKKTGKVQRGDARQKWSNEHLNGFASGSVIVMDTSKSQLVSSVTKCVVVVSAYKFLSATL